MNFWMSLPVVKGDLGSERELLEDCGYRVNPENDADELSDPVSDKNN